MADGFSFVLDDTALLAAIARLGPALQTRLKDAAHATAQALAAEMRTRLKRQLGPHASGAAVEGITVLEDPTGFGYLVVAAAPASDDLNEVYLPLWLEKGTKRGQGTHANYPRPFFYASVALEEGAHRRRIVNAVRAALDETGLGE